MKKPVYILTGPPRSGKTATVQRWLSKQDNAAGILSPVRDAVRCFLDIRSNETFPFEVVGDTSEEVVKVGRVAHYKSAFDKAKEILQTEMTSDSNWLIVDAVGKLELDGQGLEPMIYRLLQHYKEKKPPYKLLLVARNSLVRHILRDYEIVRYEIVAKWEMGNL